MLARSSRTIGSGGPFVDTRTGGERLPHSASCQTELITRHTLTEARTQQAERILLADKSEINQMIVVRLLANQDYRVDVVSNGSEALAALAQKHYALLFLDCFMPEMNGYETARRIREREALGVRRRIPIIAMTASALPEDRQKCLTSGMDDFVAKPIKKDDLLMAIQRWLPSPHCS